MRSALVYNFYVNPFSSRAADVFHHFVYIISATVVLPTPGYFACKELLLVCMTTEHNCFVYIISATVVLPTPGYFACKELLLVCMATEHNCFVNPHCSHVLSDNLYPIHSI